MSLEKQVRDFFNIAKDVDHIDSKWYAQKVRGDADDINEATFYLLKQIPARLPLHFIRGAIIGGVAGLIASKFTDIDHTFMYSFMTGTVDWAQYGTRALMKLVKLRPRRYEKDY